MAILPYIIVRTVIKHCLKSIYLSFPWDYIFLCLVYITALLLVRK